MSKKIQTLPFNEKPTPEQHGRQHVSFNFFINGDNTLGPPLDTLQEWVCERC